VKLSARLATLAGALGLDYRRIQCTNDMLPADILGMSTFDRNESVFEFHPGPVFTQVLLADEINRATSKTQSALLEAMEERQVTTEGETRLLPEPFFVIATQNPVDQSGTYRLPESQLDRFLMRIELGYPDREYERKLYEGLDPRESLKDIKPLVDAGELMNMQQEINTVAATDALLSYVERLVQYTRSDSRFSWGLSPRAAVALVRSAKAWAFIEGRNHVIPEDVQNVFAAVVQHRLRDSVDYSQGDRSFCDWIINSVEVVA
jgi:MoxR-like ATPase